MCIRDSTSAGMPLRDFADPGGKVQSGDFVSIPRVYGLSLSNAMGVLTPAGLRPVVGYAVSSSLPVGLAVGTQPAYRALRGATVVIYTSNGVAKPTPSPTTANTTPPPNPTKTKAGRPRQKP